MNKRTGRDMVYLILHYNAIEETMACVDSIRAMPSYPQSAIVIVDNASPDGSGAKLEHKYAADGQITVIRNGENSGFSKGNNLGYRYIRERFDAAFLTVCNNDIVFPEQAYTEKVRDIYNRTGFSVLGPDIWNPELSVHQSPLGKTSPDTRAVRRTIWLNGIANRTFPVFWPLVGKRDARQRFGARKDAANHEQEQENVPLMGACLILSKEFIRQKETLFEPETFLYYEEYLLYNHCRRQEMKMIYSPEIRVIHREGRATVSESDNERERYRRLVRNTLAAAKIYLKDLEKDNEGNG